jgi:hypothetical protein
VLEVSLKEMLIGNQAEEEKHEHWVGKDERSAHGTPREGIQADDTISITRGIPLRSKEQWIAGRNSPSWDWPELPERDPSEYDHPYDSGTHETNTNVSIDRNAIHHHCSLLSNPFVLIPLGLHVEL